jgi:hypothetical protein
MADAAIHQLVEHKQASQTDTELAVSCLTYRHSAVSSFDSFFNDIECASGTQRLCRVAQRAGLRGVRCDTLRYNSEPCE